MGCRTLKSGPVTLDREERLRLEGRALDERERLLKRIEDLEEALHASRLRREELERKLAEAEERLYDAWEASMGEDL